MDATQVAAPPGYKAPTTDQILRADRAGWVRMAEQVPSLRRQADGKLPLDAALDALRTDPTVIFHMMPLPSTTVKPDKPAPKPVPIKKDAVNKPDSGGKPKGKGKGKNRAGKSKGKMPAELVGLHQNMKNGQRLCYHFNLERGFSFAEVGKECQKGAHYCMRCLGAHPAYECPSKGRQ